MTNPKRNANAANLSLSRVLGTTFQATRERPLTTVLLTIASLAGSACADEMKSTDKSSEDKYMPAIFLIAFIGIFLYVAHEQQKFIDKENNFWRNVSNSHRRKSYDATNENKSQYHAIDIRNEDSCRSYRAR